MANYISDKKIGVELTIGEAMHAVEALRLTRLFGEWCPESERAVEALLRALSKSLSKAEFKRWHRKLTPFFNAAEWGEFGMRFAKELVELLIAKNPGLFIDLDLPIGGRDANARYLRHSG